MNQPPSNNSRSIAIRSLRRRLWQALLQEDEDTAIRAYTATRADYQAWIFQEEEQQEQQQARLEAAAQEKRPSLRKALKLKNKKKNKNSSLQNNKEMMNDDDDDTKSCWETDYLLISEMVASSTFVADDFLSPNDPYDNPSDETSPLTNTRRRGSRGPRFAGFWGMRRDDTTTSNDQDDIMDDDDDNEQADNNQALTTTPLHEAARLGSAKLVKLFLEHGALPNMKNGMQRTALIMAAGGLTVEEEQLYIAQAIEKRKKSPEKFVQDAGIRVPIMELQQQSNNNNDDNDDDHAIVGAKKAAQAVRRLFALGSSSDNNKNAEIIMEKPPPPPFDVQRQSKRSAQRMDTVLAILSWCHADDGSASANEGPSINSVDMRGRTALHYAAELGRVDICMAIVSSFGAILTIVDESSRTPGELAGFRRHLSLAAQLEARALLYSDPYGVDDELMASVLAEERNADYDARKKLTMPFSWFETLSPVQVRQERITRTEKALMGMQRILAERQEQEKANEVMFNYDLNDSLDSAPSVTINDDAAAEDTNEEATKGSNDASEESVHLLAELDESHPPSPPTVRSRKVAPSETDEASREDSANAAKIFAVGEPVLSQDILESSPPVVSVVSEYTHLLRVLQESHVERFLSFHNWELDKATAAFSKDPAKALSDAGVSVAASKALLKWEGMTPQTCLICFEEFDPESPDWCYFRDCEHGFCAQCIGDYVVDCARSRSGGITVICPHHECGVPLTQRELQSMVPNPSVYESLLEAADENCVASSSDLKFCPHPGCEGVVHRLVPSIVEQEGYDDDIIDIVGAACVCFPEGGDDATLTYEGVRDDRYGMTRGASQPHFAHRFCFACGDTTIHWPASCETLEKWNTKVRDEISDIDQDDEEGENNRNPLHFQDVAQRLWIKANTRPCPKCKAPIEKNEGCNHMTCTNRHCRHEFCWICRKDWKLHNSDTGGFFRCNRWEGEQDHEFYDGEEHQPRPQTTGDDEDESASANDENGYGSALHASRVAYKKSTEMKRFLHHYSRWSAHKESSILERKIASVVCIRMAPVVEAAIEFTGSAEFDFGGKGLSFVHAAFIELFECRSLLQHSYAFAFFRYPILIHVRRNRVVKLRKREKATFEQLQSELEMITEQMSDIMARAHLRATQTQIMFMTKEAAEKRNDFSSFLMTVLHDERKQNELTATDEAASDSARATVPPPIEISGIIDRLQGHAALRNEHNDMDSDDGEGASYPFTSRRLHESEHQQQQWEHDEDDELEDAEMQEALQASLYTYSAETTPVSAFSEAGIGVGVGFGVDIAAFHDASTDDWHCRACTFVNSGTTTCAMCGTQNDNQNSHHSEEDSSSDSNDDEVSSSDSSDDEDEE